MFESSTSSPDQSSDNKGYGKKQFSIEQTRGSCFNRNNSSFDFYENIVIVT